MDSTSTSRSYQNHPFVLQMTCQLEAALDAQGVGLCHLNFTCSGANALASNLSPDILNHAFHLASLTFGRQNNRGPRRNNNNGDIDNNGDIIAVRIAGAPEPRNQALVFALRTLTFRRYQFESIPMHHRIRQVFGNTLIRVDIHSNSILNHAGLHTLIVQFPMLQTLRIVQCPNVRTIEPLGSLAHPLHLRHLVVSRCNLHLGSEEERGGNLTNLWADALQALGNSLGPLTHLDLSGNSLSRIPLSHGQNLLHHVEELVLSDNCIDCIPEEMFATVDCVRELRCLILSNNCLKYLPSTIGRLRDSCEVVVVPGNLLTRPPPWHCVSVPSMRKYFTRQRAKVFWGIIRLFLALQRARLRAIDRLYIPGGMGFEKCKKRFIERAGSIEKQHDSTLSHDPNSCKRQKSAQNNKQRK